MAYEFPPSAPSPHVGISSDLLHGGAPAFRQIEVSSLAAGRVLAAMGVSAANIAQSRLWVSGEQETMPEVFDHTTTFVDIYASHTYGHTVTVFMGGVAKTLREPPPQPDPGLPAYMAREAHMAFQRHQKRAGDVSASTVEALSHLADHILIGPAALAQERTRVETRIRIKKLLPRALGALTLTAGLVGAAYANHTSGTIMPELAVDGVAVIAAGAAWWVGITRATIAALQQFRRNTTAKRWPADRRAQQWQRRYAEARTQDPTLDIVSYDLNR